MITQIKPGFKYVFFAVAITDDNGAPVDPDSANVFIYKVSQVDGSLSSAGTVALEKQQTETGFYGKAIDVSSLEAGEYIVFFKVTSGTSDSITAETMSIDAMRETVDSVDSKCDDIPTVKSDVESLQIDVASVLVTLDLLKEIESGRWEILNNQMIFYKADNVTEIMRFNLFDAAGAPASENVFERKRV